jgi:ketosteroid isomerase-like protein
MKLILLLCSLLVISCNKNEPKEQTRPAAKDEARIEEMIGSLYSGLSGAYNGTGVNTDSLIDAYYENDVRYVTPWGSTEPLDTTKARLRNAKNHIKDFDHRVEIMQVKSYGDVAYAYFILRQNYQVDGNRLEEYLPTTLVFERRGSGWKIVHAHRSTDYQTIQQYAALQKKRDETK